MPAAEGLAIAYLLDRIDRDQTMMLFYEIGVAQSHRRRGVGAALVELLKSFCRERNVMKMWVLTNRSNSAAVALDRAAGADGDPGGDEMTFGWYGAASFAG